MTKHLFTVPSRRSLAGAAGSDEERRAVSRPGWWCPSCGMEAVLTAVSHARAELGVADKDLLVVTDAGCARAFPEALACYGLEAPAGMALPMALGAKLANPDLFVLVVADRDDILGPGCGALGSACRVNADLTCLALDRGAGPDAAGRSCDPAGLAEAAGASFVGRLDASDPGGTGSVVLAGLEHRGFSFICASYSCPAKAAAQPPAKEGRPASGVVRQAADAPCWEELDETFLRRGPAVAESLALGAKESAGLEAELR
ncbi:MAG: hypothetical protein HY924_03165 [Elusimicrobia bacterium]|nr:hypothetical protein [Elusimicrobiota bacterium]